MTSTQGTSFIGYERGKPGAESFQATNPATGAALAERFFSATNEEADRTCELARTAFAAYSALSGAQRGAFLEAAASNLMKAADEIVDCYVAETGLPEARARGELGRTTSQLKLFAQLVRDGHWVNARIETAVPDRQPLPKPDVRSQLEPLGPVTVFCASNFPLAFSVAGGDTASALAAGCPVVVSAHSAHPGTAERVATCMVAAARETGMPEGTFSMLHGPGRTVGIRLVAHPAIKAAGFTGSRTGGHALMKVAAERPHPIPVYAEMSSVNPVVMLPGALEKSNRPSLVSGLVASLTMGVGQFCTNPGLVFLPTGADADAFAEELVRALAEQTPGVMLTSRIAEAYERALDEKANTSHVRTVHRAEPGDGCRRGAAVFNVNIDGFLDNPGLQSEAFGPATLLVTYRNDDDLINAIGVLEGQLTGTIHAAESDHPLPPPLVAALKSKVGRVIINQFPTGVEVCHAMVHGGPYPSTSEGRSTSVGTLAIERFCRPVCYQNFPNPELPQALRNENPLGIWRLVNGKLEQGAVG